MLVGYMRVSTKNQSFDSQKDHLKKAGCEKFYSDVVTGARSESPGLKNALSFLRKGDVLVVWKLDRLGRSLRHLIDIITELDEKGIGFKSLQEGFDTTTSGGKLIFHIFGALAEFERVLIRERTMAGLESARARGRSGGRPKKMNDNKIKTARTLHKDKSNSIEYICKVLNISRATLYRYLKEDISSNEENKNGKG